jgi:hypothetical protein
MLKRIQRILNNLSTHISLYQFFSGGLATVGGLVVYCMARANDWIKGYGALGIFFAVIIGMLVIVLMCLVVVHIRYKWFYAEAVRGWERRVQNINPLDNDFNAVRIKISDLVHPVTRKILNKKFTDCELIGPENIIFSDTSGNSAVWKVKFGNCNLIVFDPKKITSMAMANFVVIENPNIFRGEIWNCNIFIPPNLLDTFKKMGMTPLTCEN